MHKTDLKQQHVPISHSFVGMDDRYISSGTLIKKRWWKCQSPDCIKPSDVTIHARKLNSVLSSTNVQDRTNETWL